MLNAILLVVGLVLILCGANYLTDGSAAIARRFGISDLIVGLTIVAFGTSAPELTISIMSRPPEIPAWQSATSLAAIYSTPLL